MIHLRTIQWSWMILFAFLQLILPSTEGRQLQFGNGLIESNREFSGQSEYTFSVSEDGTTALCSLFFTIYLSKITSAYTDCKLFYDNYPHHQIMTTSHSWTFYDNIDQHVAQTYKIDATLWFNPTENTVHSLQLCLTSACGTQDLTATCLSYPESDMSSSSGPSMISSVPEGFILAFKKSSSTETLPSSWSSGASIPSSVPEGFIFAFKQPSSASSRRN